MKILCFIMATAFMLSGGCGRRPEPPAPQTDPAALVRDALNQLLVLHPPAKTKLRLIQPIDNAFGAALMAALREQGYAVVEYVPPPNEGKKGVSPSVTASPTDGYPGLDFSYSIDDAGDETRLALRMGGERIGRLYRRKTEDGVVSYTPIGFWTRMQ